MVTIGDYVFPESTAYRQKVAIVNGRVIDPANNFDSIATLCMESGRIVSVSDSLPDAFSSGQILNAAGYWVVPGLVDMHVHLREPGQEEKETIVTGTHAAAAGGFTGIACMPNTVPALDTGDRIRYVLEKGRSCPCRVYPVGAITRGLAGEIIADIDEMLSAGIRGISDDGKTVANAHIMLKAMEQTQNRIPFLCHCEDKNLVNLGVMNAGSAAMRLGLAGIPAISEDVAVARDILLANEAGVRVHICHVSTAGSVELIRWAKQRKISVTAETCPHYFILTDEDVSVSDTNRKMNPPLRGIRDRDAILEGLADGTIDVIASDHAPHAERDKNVLFEKASFGAAGLETMLGASIRYLVNTGVLTPANLIRKMSCIPNAILGSQAGHFTPGAIADITIIDPEASWKVEASSFLSKGRNTPFQGMELVGRSVATFLEGNISVIRKDARFDIVK